MSVLEEFPPIHGETFFSWLHRQSVFNKHHRYPLYMLLEDYERFSHALAFDRDFDISAPFVRNALEQLRMSCSDLGGIFNAGSTWLMPEHFRRAFCWECLQEHVVSHGYPGHMSSWCSVSQTHCSRHGSLLRECRRSNQVSLNFGLNAFVSYCANAELYETDALHKLFSSKLLSDLCQLVADIILKKESESGGGGSGHVGYSSHVYRTLMGIMLRPSGGIINTILKRRRVAPYSLNVWQSLSSAPLCSSVLDRAIALLLVGMATGDIAGDDREAMLSLLSSSPFLDIRFYDPSTLGASCNTFSRDAAKTVIELLDGFCSALNSPSLELFLSGFSYDGRK